MIQQLAPTPQNPKWSSKRLVVSLKAWAKPIVLVLSVGILLLLSWAAMTPRFAIRPEEWALPSTPMIRDERGAPLRFWNDESRERHQWIPLNQVPTELEQAFLAAEDSRFYRHHGVDGLAVIRALKDNAAEGSVVSGASTISQQVVRLIEPRPRTYRSKAIEAVMSLRMERQKSKRAILEQYLNRVPMGGNLVGVRIASQVYFRKPCKALSPAECAILAALPQSPSFYDPYGSHRDRLMMRKDWILTRMRRLGFLDEETFRIAKNEAVRIEPFDMPMEAPHFVDQIIASRPAGPGDCVTTLDLRIQRTVEEIVRSHRLRLLDRGAEQACAMVVANDSLEVKALVGSLSYSERQGGYNNGALARRSPGSTLKPFLTGLALDSGFAASQIIPDVENVYDTPQGEYFPRNFNRQTYGPVTLRVALGSSLNLATVGLLRTLGCEAFFGLLQDVGFLQDSASGPGDYGLGLAVGNPEVSLQELVAGYAALANGGVVRGLCWERRRPAKESRRVLTPQAAFIVTDMLQDVSAKMGAFPNVRAFSFEFPVAVKTGTSTHYRDAWAIGYTPNYSVGVWVGNFDGQPTRDLSGADGAAPIFADIMRALYPAGGGRFFDVPDGVQRMSVCAESGLKPGSRCDHVINEWFIVGTEPQKACATHAPGGGLALPARYASWVYQKEQEGTAGRYRIQGSPCAFSDPWEKAAEDDQKGLVKVYGQAKVEGPSEANEPDEPSRDEARHSVRPIQNRLEITYPFDGDRFVLEEAREGQWIRLQAESQKAVPTVVWSIDGMEYAQTGPPYQTAWRPTRGVHTILVSDEGANADGVTITVE